MARSSLEKVLAEVQAERQRGTQKKRAYLYLHGPRLAAFKKLCRSLGGSASAAIDRWIAEELEASHRKR